MKKSKFTDSQIMEALKQAESGLAVPGSPPQKRFRFYLPSRTSKPFSLADGRSSGMAGGTFQPSPRD